MGTTSTLLDDNEPLTLESLRAHLVSLTRSHSLGLPHFLHDEVARGTQLSRRRQRHVARDGDTIAEVSEGRRRRPRLHPSREARPGRLWALEEKLAHARRHFNDSVTEWNTRTQSFPGVLLAKVARFEPSPLFAAEPEWGASCTTGGRNHRRGHRLHVSHRITTSDADCATTAMQMPWSTART